MPRGAKTGRYGSNPRRKKAFFPASPLNVQMVVPCEKNARLSPASTSVGMSPPSFHRLTDVEGAVLDEISSLARIDGPAVPIKDLELRLEDRGFTDSQTRRALMSLLRRGQVELTGAKRVSSKTTSGPRH